MTVPPSVTTHETTPLSTAPTTDVTDDRGTPLRPARHATGSTTHVTSEGVTPLRATPLTATALAVGFDLDLTLVDSRDRVLSAYIRALRDLGIVVTSEELVPHLGMPLAETAAAVGAAVDADALVLRYRHYYDEPDAPPTLPMPGALAALRCVRAAGGRSVVVSAKFTPAVHHALAEAGLSDLVDVVYGELFALEKAAALIAQSVSIYVGDHPGDMAAARAASAYAVGVTTGANDSATMLAAGADLALPDLDTFVAWLPARISGASAQ